MLIPFEQVSWFKRYKMEIALVDLPAPCLPAGYRLTAWDEALLSTHAEVTYWSFVGEIDATVFPSLGDRFGCLNLMREIRRKAFLPGATWLAEVDGVFCGSIQGIRLDNGQGAIQNVGVTPSHRGLGLGAAMVIQALHGFRQHGLKTAMLEVTAQNEAAIRLYRRLGFRKRKTIYKPVASFALAD